MRRTPVTLGVLSIIFGSLVALSSLGQVALSAAGPALTQLAAKAPSSKQPPFDVEKLKASQQQLMTELRPYNDALAGGKLVLSVALVIIGAGMYRRRRWSRSGALAWSGLALLYLVAEMIVRVTIIQPRTNAIMDQLLADAPPSAQAMMATVQHAQGPIAVVMLLVLFAPYPLVLLALCGRSSAAADFTD